MDASGAQAQKTMLGQANKSSYTFVLPQSSTSGKPEQTPCIGSAVLSHLLESLLAELRNTRGH